MSTTAAELAGVPVIIKFDVCSVTFVNVSEKNGVELAPSGRALTTMDTPDVGRLAVTLTVTGKSGPREAGSTEPSARSEVTVNEA